MCMSLIYVHSILNVVILIALNEHERFEFFIRWYKAKGKQFGCEASFWSFGNLAAHSLACPLFLFR